MNSIHHPNPRSERIRPLQSKLWRSNDLRQHGVTQSWGAKFEGPLSASWGYPLSGNLKPPYENVAACGRPTSGRSRSCREAGRSTGTSRTSPTRSGAGVERGTRSSRPGYEQQTSSRQRWVRIPRSADRARRRFSRRSSKRSCPVACAPDCEVNFLCWHELEPWSDIALVEKNVRYARREYVDSTRFKALKLSEIHVNEYVGEVDQYRPAELLAFLFYLEHGGADYSSRSCWRSGSGFGHVVAIAQGLPAGADQVQALIGYYGHEGATAQRLPVEVRLSGLSRIVKGRRAVIKAIRMPDSGARTVNTLPVVYDKVTSTMTRSHSASTAWNFMRSTPSVSRRLN
jgi:hypothetical protein